MIPRYDIVLHNNMKNIFEGNIIQFLIRGEEDERDEDVARKKLKQLKLSNDAIWAREELRDQVQAPWIIKAPYYILCYFLDVLFDKKPIAR